MIDRGPLPASVPCTYVDTPFARRLPGLVLALVLLATTPAANAGERGAVGDLYACNVRHGNILQFDGLTGEFVCIFAECPPELDPDWEFQPFDLAWAPNGNLWVTSSGVLSDRVDCVVEYNGQTGAFLGYVVEPAVDAPCDVSLTFGGQNGNLYVADHTAVLGDESWQIDRLTRANLGVAVSPSPPMNLPQFTRFTSSGTYVILGQALGNPVPTVREYDATTLAFLRDFAVESDTGRYGIIETPDQCCYLLSDITARNNVEAYDKTTSSFLDEFIPESPCLALGPQLPACNQADACYWEAMDGPVDLAFGPNGHLYVSAERTHSPVDQAWKDFGVCSWATGGIHEFDAGTGEQIRVIGHETEPYEFPHAAESDATKIYQGAGIEFKPMPGDWCSSGSTFQGDWQVNEQDLTRFAAALDGSAADWTTAANLQSFDLDRNGAIDCADWPAFAAAFAASSGYAPPRPLPEVPEFVAALLGDSDRPCLADRNDDGVADGRDIGPYVAALLH